MILLSKALEDQAAAVQAAAALWYEWAIERGFDDPDLEHFIGLTMDRVRSGRYCIIVDYAETGEPRGMVDIQLDYEPGTREMVAYVDRLYVLKEHRGKGIARGLADAIETCARVLMLADVFVLFVKPDGPRQLYLKRGFSDDMTIMRWHRNGRQLQ